MHLDPDRQAAAQARVDAALAEAGLLEAQALALRAAAASIARTWSLPSAAPDGPGLCEQVTLDAHGARA